MRFTSPMTSFVKEKTVDCGHLLGKNLHVEFHEFSFELLCVCYYMLLFSLFNIHINLPNHPFLKIGQTHFSSSSRTFKQATITICNGLE